LLHFGAISVNFFFEKVDFYLMFFNPLTQYLLGVINSMPMKQLKKINNSSQQRVGPMAALVSWVVKD
jgi:hypothetical protein